ncbi:dihydrofolate reductase family protein [Pseudogemmatithrix spongiicola]|uniref:Dihydrofolate reductase family protein n=1 Tax=Pseudogemmatithrix spongiicola TaxID=3062599 RepID=A0AA49JTV2_9BACT|nr:dihydrofolate reductase family protein [Gemmatimonadaceae bacterium 'strain 138']WKW14448.1 dihydrofolate reductase family protein [Gemmatimonadaceae bacterium 'strain 318']
MPAHVFIATSLDGYIARLDGGIDWLPQPSGDADVDDHGYSAFMAGIDAIVMGRNTYETVLTFGAWPFEKPVVVLSSGQVRIAPELAGRIVAMAGEPAEIMAACAERGWQHLYIDGGVTIQRFLRAGLIERLIVTRVPVVLGTGLPLFGAVERDVRFAHVRTQAYPSGLVQSEYRAL